jgi:hypothetical protein
MGEMNNVDETVCQILMRAEELYERLGNPLVSATRHRRAWAFARAFGATRLAHELSVPRATVVTARRQAFQRWQYWMTRYEEPLWQHLLRLAGDPRDWEGCMVRYRRLRALVRHDHLPPDTDEGQTDALVACALRSLASVPWDHDDRACWQTVWRLLMRRQVRRAHTVATVLGWSAIQWRRSRRVVSRLGALVWLPLSQRQLLALSTWPASHLRALQETGQALFPTHGCRLLQVAHLPPRRIVRMANMTINAHVISHDNAQGPYAVEVTTSAVIDPEHEEPAYDA